MTKFKTLKDIEVYFKKLNKLTIHGIAILDCLEGNRYE